MRALLDVNVLIALLDASHIHHTLARSWLERNGRSGWASCPITENGCIRIMSQPGYSNTLPAAVVAERLCEAAASSFHEFWADSISLLNSGHIDWTRILGSRQVTDAYLLSLAVKHQGRFVTFDNSVAISAVPGAQKTHLEVIV